MHLETRSRVGPDGVLAFSIPVGLAAANREVKVTVESLDSPESPPVSQEDWRRFVDETAGRWQGEPLARPEQGEFESRDLGE